MVGKLHNLKKVRKYNYRRKGMVGKLGGQMTVQGLKKKLKSVVASIEKLM
jgi:hypothetical protein